MPGDDGLPPTSPSTTILDEFLDKLGRIHLSMKAVEESGGVAVG